MGSVGPGEVGSSSSEEDDILVVLGGWDGGIEGGRRWFFIFVCLLWGGGIVGVRIGRSGLGGFFGSHLKHPMCPNLTWF